MEKLGLNHLYTGDGKGKTTAAIGLAVRAAGAGYPVMFAQFMKGRYTSELASLEKLSNITIRRNQKDFGFYKQMTEQEKIQMKQMHTDTLQEIHNFIEENQTGVIVLDEVTSAYEYQLVPRSDICSILDTSSMEVVVTGRNPHRELVERADYITEMKLVRHPFEKGIEARGGIEC